MPSSRIASKSVVLLATLLAATTGHGAPAVTPGMPGQPPLAIENVTVLDLERDRKLANCTVLVRDGLIEALSDKEIELPKQALRIDGTGLYLLPGLAEMHAHIPSQSQGTAYTNRVLFLYLAAGVTTVRGMLGEPGHLRLRAAAKGYELLSPRIYTSGPSFNGRSVNSPTAARNMARSQHMAGYDFLKLHPGLTRDEYDALVDTANDLDIPFAGHVSAEVGITRTLQARQATIDHLDGYMQALVTADYQPDNAGFFGAALVSGVDEQRIDEVAKATAAANVWNVPTQSLIENFVLPVDADTMATRPEMRYMPASTVATWRRRKSDVLASPEYDAASARRFVDVRHRLILALHKAGAKLLLGSDAPQVFNVPGFAIHRELETLVEAGLTPREALLTGTANPARFFGASNTFGFVRAGLEADLLLLYADPTQNIGNISKIAGVVARGRWLSRETIDRRLEKLAHK
ncbi:MAG: amidohydrolase family protein [Gammaproteobacteria bacterium]|nr:amidohydrolase family protein [Gammaproteobacteria bacterium]